MYLRSKKPWYEILPMKLLISYYSFMTTSKPYVTTVERSNYFIFHFNILHRKNVYYSVCLMQVLVHDIVIKVHNCHDLSPFLPPSSLQIQCEVHCSPCSSYSPCKGCVCVVHS
uniref:Uncharacterized protein n=1 Tax=Cacopsylla melanoneura TaxID=428564 RepID=A0A8D8ZE94_9HEMI